MFEEALFWAGLVMFLGGAAWLVVMQPLGALVGLLVAAVVYGIAMALRPERGDTWRG